MYWKLYLQALLLLILALLAAAAYQPHGIPKTWDKSDRSHASVILPVSGNVYPKGYYHVMINIGQPPKPYFLDIDTGSDLTWLQCDAPCTKCTPVNSISSVLTSENDFNEPFHPFVVIFFQAPHSLYKPNRNLITCQDPLCASLHGSGNHHCSEPQEQCDYQVDYADSGSSLGVLVKDYFTFRFTNGHSTAPLLGFGCGYNQEVQDSAHLPYTDGVLGLGHGNSSVLAQLSHMGLTKNVVGHCLSGKGNGFIFFGDDFLPSSGITWGTIISQSKHYSLGLADIWLGGKATNIRDLQIVFDSGSTYTYFNPQAYRSLVSLIKGNLNGKQLKDAPEDNSLPICWKGPKPFRSVQDASTYFTTLTLRFANAKSVQFPLSPQAYLIVTDHGNVCLGILDGGEVGLGDTNVIGDISLQDKLVIYDNERRRIGWAPAACDRLPNTIGESSWLSFGANFGFLDELCPAGFGLWKKARLSIR